MDLLTALLNAEEGAPVRHLAQNFGLNADQVTSAISALLPALGQGLARNASTPGGLQDLLSALSSGRHERYLREPEVLNQPETVEDGNGILGHILGSKEVSRQVAGQASTATGLGQDLLKKMLPVVAALAMGALSRQSASAGSRNAAAEDSDGLTGLLSQFLDGNRDGSIIDDVLGLASRFLRK